MEMILLDGEVDDAHPQALLGGAEGLADDAIAARPAQVRDAGHDPGGDVDRVARIERGAPRMCDLGDQSLRLAPGSGTLAAPGAREGQIELTRASCLRHRAQIGPTRRRSRTTTRNG